MRLPPGIMPNQVQGSSPVMNLNAHPKKAIGDAGRGLMVQFLARAGVIIVFLALARGDVHPELLLPAMEPAREPVHGLQAQPELPLRTPEALRVPGPAHGEGQAPIVEPPAPLPPLPLPDPI